MWQYCVTDQCCVEMSGWLLFNSLEVRLRFDRDPCGALSPNFLSHIYFLPSPLASHVPLDSRPLSPLAPKQLPLQEEVGGITLGYLELLSAFGIRLWFTVRVALLN